MTNVQQQSPVQISPASQQSPDTLSPQFLSGSGSYTQGPLPGSPNPNYFPVEIQAQYMPAYADQQQQLPPSQLSPSQSSPLQRSLSYSSLQFANGFPTRQPHPQSAGGRPTHIQRSSGDYLLPPAPTHHHRSHSRGHSFSGQTFSNSSYPELRGHRSTISEGSAPPNFLAPTGQLSTSPDSNFVFLSDAMPMRGRGLNRSKTAPTAHMGVGRGSHSRGRSPYERPPSQTSQQDVFDSSIPIPASEDPSLDFASNMELPPSPPTTDVNAQVATTAMIDAANRRRKREAAFFCSSPGCNSSFTTENSKKSVYFPTTFYLSRC